jgi:hypothetical protein
MPDQSNTWTIRIREHLVLVDMMNSGYLFLAIPYTLHKNLRQGGTDLSLVPKNRPGCFFGTEGDPDPDQPGHIQYYVYCPFLPGSYSLIYQKRALATWNVDNEGSITLVEG